VDEGGLRPQRPKQRRRGESETTTTLESTIAAPATRGLR
jgi:hypothetical protein